MADKDDNPLMADVVEPSIDDEQPPPALDDDDDEDIFAPTSKTSPSTTLNTSLLQMAESSDLFASAHDDIDLSDEPEPAAVLVASNTPTLALNTDPPLAPVDFEKPQSPTKEESIPAPVIDTSSLAAASVVPSLSPVQQEKVQPPQEVEESLVPKDVTPKPHIMPSTHEEELKMLDFKLTVPKHEKIGEGMSSYVKYQVIFEPRDIGQYKEVRYEVWRRFSDFLGLFNRLHEKHAPLGRVIPSPPSKDATGNIKTRVGKEDDTNTEFFLDSRRRGLERYLVQTAKHPIFCVDLEFREFVTNQSELKRSTETHIFSIKNIGKTVNKLTDKLTKVTAPIRETDPYFQNIAEWADLMHADLDKLAYGFDVTVGRRRDYCRQLNELQYSLGLLAAAEESVSLSRALSTLSKTHEDIALAHDSHGDADLHIMSEFAHTHARMLNAIKMALMERCKVWQRWQDAQSSLNAKRTKKTQLELAAQTAKIPQAKFETEEAEKLVNICEQEFIKISRTLRADIQYYDKDRVNEFKRTLVDYMRELAKAQAQVVDVWQRFKPEADSIEVDR